MEGVWGLALLASTRSRKLDVLRGVVSFGADAMSAESRVLRLALGVRFLLIVTFLIAFVSHSLLGISSASKDSSGFCSFSAESLFIVNFCGSSVGMISASSCSSARPKLLTSITVLNRSKVGVTTGLPSAEYGSSRAVLKDSALDDGYVKADGRSGKGVLIDSTVRGGLGSGVGGLRWFTGVLREDVLESNADTTLSACCGGGGLKLAGGVCSPELEGGVGGKPESAPLLNALGDRSDARC